MLWRIVFLGLLPLGCTATCLRDSDCIGASMCMDNRCILIDGADAGRSAPADTSDNAMTPDDTSSSFDAGSSNP